MFLTILYLSILCGHCLSQNLNCSVTGTRVDCGHPNIDRTTCEDTRNCCWDLDHEEGSKIPKCFFPESNGHFMLQCDSNATKHDCGVEGITQPQCEAMIKGCCWLVMPGDPYCFTKTRINISSSIEMSSQFTISPATSLVGALSSIFVSSITAGFDITSQTDPTPSTAVMAVTSASEDLVDTVISTINTAAFPISTREDSNFVLSILASTSFELTASTSAPENTNVLVVSKTTGLKTSVFSKRLSETQITRQSSGIETFFVLLALIAVVSLLGTVAMCLLLFCLVLAVGRRKQRKSCTKGSNTAGDDMFTNSMYGISLLDRLLLPAESIKMESNEAYGHLVHETAVENTYEQVTLPNKAKLDSASFPSQYDYITNNSVFDSEF